MNDKNKIFLTAHLVEHASKRLQMSPKALYKLATYVSHIGHFSTIDSLKKVADPQNTQSVNKLVEVLNLDEDADYSEEVDEGKFNHHLYFPNFVENHTNEPSGVNDFGGFSVPEGFTP